MKEVWRKIWVFKVTRAYLYACWLCFWIAFRRFPSWGEIKLPTPLSTLIDPFSAATETLVLGNLIKLVDLPSHSHGHFAIGVMKRIRWLSYFLMFIRKSQTSRANVMSSLKSFNKLPITRAFSAAEKWTVRSTGVSGSISPQDGNLRR